MPRVSIGKIKFLYIIETLLRKTDDEHKLSSTEFIRVLSENGLTADRKSVYDDIETLKEFGMDILYDKEEPSGYYVANREFELPELKLLVDAVQSSKFITAKKSNALISKIEKLTSTHQAKKLQRQVYVSRRVKTMNESIYYNVDAIHSAIQENKQIKFKYMKWNLEKQLVPKNDGDVISSPWALTWDDENYYMVGYDEKNEMAKHYRVDKMKEIVLLGDRRKGKEIFNSFDIAEFATRTFGMFGGKVEKVTLECDNNLIGAIIDRFGTDIIIVPYGEDKFKVSRNVAVSGQFFGWVVGLGPGARITHPPEVVKEFKERLKKML